MKLARNSKLLFKYLKLPNGLGGRGGTVRFMLLSHGIPFEEKLIEFADWPAEKERLKSSGENPCGNVPLLYHGDDTKKGDFPLSQHVASCRYVAKVHGLSPGNDGHYHEYIQDLVSDEYQGFRNEFASAVFYGGDKAKYAKSLPKHLTKFEALYAKFRTHAVFLSLSPKTGQPLWGDAAMFNLLRDNVLTGFVSVEDLGAYPNLSAMFHAYGSIPAVSQWCKNVEEKKDSSKL